MAVSVVPCPTAKLTGVFRFAFLVGWFTSARSASNSSGPSPLIYSHFVLVRSKICTSNLVGPFGKTMVKYADVNYNLLHALTAYDGKHA